jgi:hypothetical protein
MHTDGVIADVAITGVIHYCQNRYLAPARGRVESDEEGNRDVC